MEEGKGPKKTRTIGVFLLAVFSAVIAFFVTCQTVTVGVVSVSAPVARGDAAFANYIGFGLFLGISLGLVVAWLVARKVESLTFKFREKKED